MLLLNTNKAIGSVLKLFFLMKYKLTAKASTFLRNALVEDSTTAYTKYVNNDDHVRITVMMMYTTSGCSYIKIYA